MASQNANKESKGWALPSLVGVLGVAIASYFAYGQVNPSTAVQYDTHDYAARTEAILKSTPLIDGHNDLPFLLRLELHNQIYDNKSFPFRESELPVLWTIAVPQSPSISN